MSASFDIHNFNFNPRTGRDSRFQAMVMGPDGFQSTYQCGVRQTSTAASSTAKKVSIHAPARGATTGILYTSGSMNCYWHYAKGQKVLDSR